MNGATVLTTTTVIQKRWKGSANRRGPPALRAGADALHVPLWRCMQSCTVVHTSVVISHSCSKGSRCPQNSQQHGFPVKSRSVSALYVPHIANGRVPCQKGLPYLSCSPRLHGCGFGAEPALSAGGTGDMPGSAIQPMRASIAYSISINRHCLAQAAGLIALPLDTFLKSLSCSLPCHEPGGSWVDEFSSAKRWG